MNSLCGFSNHNALKILSAALVICLATILLPAKGNSAVPKQHAQNIPFQNCFRIASRLHDVPTPLLQGVAYVESRFNASALSSARAIGVMQIRWPQTARHLGVRRPAELYKPCLNIERGAAYLRELLDRYNGSLQYSLAAYHYGPGRVALNKSNGKPMPGSKPDWPSSVDRYISDVLSRAKVYGAQGPDYNLMNQNSARVTGGN